MEDGGAFSVSMELFSFHKPRKKIRSHDADLTLIVGIGDLGIIISNYNQLLYSWPPHMDANVLLAIRRAVMRWYSDTMCDARQYAAGQLKAIEGIEFDNYDYRMLISYPSEWIMNEYWVQMIDRAWNKDEFRRSCKANTSNRNTKY